MWRFLIYTFPLVLMCVFVLQSEQREVRTLGILTVVCLVGYTEVRISLLKQELLEQQNEEKPKRGLPSFAEERDVWWGDPSITNPTSYYLDKRGDEHPDGVLMERNNFASPWVWRKKEERKDG